MHHLEWVRLVVLADQRLGQLEEMLTGLWETSDPFPTEVDNGESSSRTEDAVGLGNDFLRCLGGNFVEQERDRDNVVGVFGKGEVLSHDVVVGNLVVKCCEHR